jgi:hypothetical protein
MRLLFYSLIWATLLPTSLLAQKPLPINRTFTELDQELDDFSGRLAGIHRITAKMRGVQGANQTSYWVSADGQQLSAYQAGKLLWTNSVAVSFKAGIPAARITSLVLSSRIIFVSLGKRGSAEVDRNTGRIVSKYFDRDPTNTVAEPR